MKTDGHHVDKTVAKFGRTKSSRIDLGLELLARRAMRGRTLTQHDLAAWCGCTRGAIYLIEKQAMKKLRTRLLFGRCRQMGKEIAA